MPVPNRLMLAGQAAVLLLGTAPDSRSALTAVTPAWALTRFDPSRSRLFGDSTQVQVVVRDNNVDQALRALKKKMQREGVFREMKLRNYYEKPSEKRAREKAEAIRRARKLARKRAQREGLVAGRGRGRGRR